MSMPPTFLHDWYRNNSHFCNVTTNACPVPYTIVMSWPNNVWTRWSHWMARVYKNPAGLRFRMCEIYYFVKNAPRTLIIQIYSLPWTGVYDIALWCSTHKAQIFQSKIFKLHTAYHGIPEVDGTTLFKI